MIRWSYVLPRLLVIAAVLGFVAFALDPLIHWGLTRVGERLIGARVELNGVKTSLMGAKLRLDGFRVADPSSPMKNLFEADAMFIDVDAESLLLRRFVIERGHISGLRLDTDRQTSGAIDGATVGEQASDFEFDESWLAALADGALNELTKDFESIQLIETAEERWNGRTDGLKERVAALKRRAKQFKERYGKFNGRDPRQVAEVLQQGPVEIDLMRRELDLLRQEIQGLHGAVATEFENLSAARERDMQRWRKKIRIREYNAVQFSSYLLGPTLRSRLDEAMQWVDAGQEIAEKTSAPKGREFSNEVIRFSDYPVPPNVLIRELIVDGELTFNGQPLPFAAIASDVAFPPTQHTEPIRIRMQTKGEINARITGVLDYRTARPLQQLQVDCPDLAIPAKQLGKPGKFALRSAAGRGVVRCNMQLQDGRVKGRIHFYQPNASLSADVSSKLGGRVRDSLQASLAGIRSLEATVSFEGDPRNPSYTIDSDLGAQVSAAVNSAAKAELEHQQQRLKGRLDKEIQTRLAKFQTKVEAKKQALLADLNLDAQQLQQLLNLLPQSRLGQLNMPLQLPLNGYFRR